MAEIICEDEARAEEIAPTPFVPENLSQKNDDAESTAASDMSVPQNVDSVVGAPQNNTVEKTAESSETTNGNNQLDQLAEPGIIINYRTLRSQPMTVRKGVIETLIKDQIDSKNLPAGMVGMPYKAIIELSNKDLVNDFDGIEIVAITTSTALKNLGLECKKNTSTSICITGTPLKDFSEKLWFFFVCTEYKKDLPKIGTNPKSYNSFTEYPSQYTRSKPFVINAHPRDLWQNLPVADYDGYENPYTAARGGEIFAPEAPRQLEIIAASTRGRSHAHIAKPRDDYFQFSVNAETGWNFIAVADGAGSAKYSRKGAQLACETVIQNLNKKLSAEFTQKCQTQWLIYYQDYRDKFKQNNGKAADDLKKEFMEKTQLDVVFHGAVRAAHTAIREETAKRDGAKLNDYHTTLLCAAFRYFPELSSWFIASYWIGDGGAALLRWNGTDRVLVLGEPDGGEFAGQTKFLTMPSEIYAAPIYARLRFSFADVFSSLLLVTDGITDPFFPSEAAVGDEPQWLEFYEEKLRNGCEEEPRGCPEIFAADKSPDEKAAALLRWLDFWSKGNHDDRTVLIVKEKET